MAMRKLFRMCLVVVLSIATLTQVASASFQQEIPTRTSTHHLYIIGDSLTVGPELFAGLSRRVTTTRKWNSTVVNAKVGRTIPQGIAVLQKAKFRTPTAIVVALGTNDLLSRRQSSYAAQAIDDFMRAAQGRPVLWLNVEFSQTRPDWRSRGVRFNKELRKATTRWPNLEIADWDKHFTPLGPSRFIHDGIHLTVTGYRTRTTFMVRQFNRWADRMWEQSITTTTSTMYSPPTTQTPEPPVDLDTHSPSPGQ
jgi:lysophospholipase L1-like esterase